MHYFATRKDAVRFVEKTIRHLGEASTLTITIEQGSYAGYYVFTVTHASSGDTPTQHYLKKRQNT